MERINAGGIRNFSPLAFVERLMQLKLDQDGLKDVTVRARPSRKRGRDQPRKKHSETLYQAASRRLLSLAKEINISTYSRINMQIKKGKKKQPKM